MIDNGVKATPHDELMAQIMDHSTPKTEREWAAQREIQGLREALEKIVSMEPTEEEFIYMGPGFALSRIRAAAALARKALVGDTK